MKRTIDPPVPAPKREWHIQDVGTVSAGGETGGVRVRNIGFDLAMAPGEARELANALLEAADNGRD